MFKKTKIFNFLSPSDKKIPKENTPLPTERKTIFSYSDTK